ncbi:MAG: single-stranded-DNA-specific exonuclease RecJ [Planctomycetes bacterium]|nr:single-stranded-DNA-specific exonuclease RecJ [Planctomycetota bacterium]
MEKKWKLPTVDTEVAKKLARDLGINTLTAMVLLRRGIDNADEARSFIMPSLRSLHDPFLMKDMDKAVARIRKAVDDKEKICIYGDYDVDGTTGSSLLYHFFRMIEANVTCYIPNRLTDGYGLNSIGLQWLKDNKINLVITVDNGASAVAQVANLKAAGIETIITDHHEVPEIRPDAVALLNPKQRDCNYPFPMLAGVGVAFKLAWALAKSFCPGQEHVSKEFQNFLLHSLAFVCIGTIADVVPLVGENRVFVTSGLKIIPETPNPGIRALLDLVKPDAPKIRTTDIGFLLAPRINAGGRMGRSELGLRLLTSDSYHQAYEIAREIDKENKSRQELQSHIFAHVLEKLKAQPDFESRKSIVVAIHDQHAGVIGIVASKLVDAFHKPAFMICVEDGKGRGSCRSVPGFDIHHALSNNAELFNSFGGHSMAAGFDIDPARIDSLSDIMEREVEKQVQGDSLKPTIDLDAEIPLASLTLPLLRELEKLEPFGAGNAEPIFVVRGVQLAGRPRIMGRDQTHLSFYVNSGGVSHKAIAFGMADKFKQIDESKSLDIAFRPTRNVWRGTESAELDVCDIRCE